MRAANEEPDAVETTAVEPFSVDGAAAEPPVRRGILRRWWFWALIVLVLLGAVAAAGLFIASRGLEARSELESAQALVPELREQAMSLDIDAATATFETITGHTARAVELTDDVVWRTGEKVPVLGANLTAVRELAAVTDQVMTEVAAPLIGVAGAIDPASFTPKDGGIDIEPLVDAVPAVQDATVGVADAIAALDAIDTDGTITQLADAKEKLAGLLGELGPTLENLNTVLPLLPPALGSDGPRTYVLMFQNPAESRALGGTALSFVVLNVEAGSITLSEPLTTSRKGDGFTTFPKSLIPLPDGADEIYPGYLGTYIANATSRPSFTTAAEITRAIWQADFGYDIDGVLSMDPLVLGYILEGSDPIPLATGDDLTSDTVVDVLLNGVYREYDSVDTVNANIVQDAVYSAVIDETFARMMSGQIDPGVVVDAMVRGWDERRLLYWSADPAEHAQLESIGLNGEIPLSDADTERVGVYFLDNVGSKLNYYLRQDVKLSRASCRDDGLQSNRVTVDLTNELDPADASTVSPSVVGAFRASGVERGDQRLFVLLYAPPGAEITGATVGGSPVALADLHDAEFPVGKLIVTVPPGETVTVSYDFVSAEAGERELEAQVTPMVQPATITTEPLDCATVAG